MTDTAGATITKSAGSGPNQRPGLLPLVIALAFVAGCRLLLYIWMPDRPTDFDFLYNAAARLLRGENPYPPATQWFPYPVAGGPAGRAIHDDWAGAGTSDLRHPGWMRVRLCALAIPWDHRTARGGVRGLPLRHGEGPDHTAHGGRGSRSRPRLPARGPAQQLGRALDRMAFAADAAGSGPFCRSEPCGSAVVALGLVAGGAAGLRIAAAPDHASLWIRPPAGGAPVADCRKDGFLLAIALIPQSTLPYELVPLALIPANRLEMGIYVLGTWIAVAAAEGWHLSDSMAKWTATGWPVTLCAVYLPMMYLVLRRPSGRKGPRVEKERRRPHRLDDDELEVDVTTDGEGGVVAKVTHLPTKLSVTESGKTRGAAVRKAQDKLAGIMAERRRSPEILP